MSTEPEPEAEGNLLDLLSDEVCNHPDFCDGYNYDRWERDIATPALRALGYEPTNWRSTDHDSFGPLVRAVDLSLNGGPPKTYFYG